MAQDLLDYARGNNVIIMVLGAATHGLKTQRFVATVPIKVAMDAPCSIVLVKQTLPFEQLGKRPQDALANDNGYSDSASDADLLLGDNADHILVEKGDHHEG